MQLLVTKPKIHFKFYKNLNNDLALLRAFIGIEKAAWATPNGI
jgi:hypothetical protein